MRRRGRTSRVRRGFTLIEGLATIAILGAIGSVASTVILSSVDSYIAAATMAEIHTEASIALDRMARELRKIPLDASAAGIAPDIDDVTSTTITWEVNSYVSLISGNLWIKIAGGTASILLSDVTAFTPKLYDESNSLIVLPVTTTACDPIRRIELTITVQRYGVSETLRSRVFLRSTMEGAG
jgi:prepilin-type N-terminal cleavage/methylation domain-containing protein